MSQLKGKLQLSILYSNMESWIFPSNLYEAKDSSLNIPNQLSYAELNRTFNTNLRRTEIQILACDDNKSR
ncbi:MAG: hypothetical protein ACYC25_09375 [Paludibacter sp.]